VLVSALRPIEEKNMYCTKISTAETIRWQLKTKKTLKLNVVH